MRINPIVNRPPKPDPTTFGKVAAKPVVRLILKSNDNEALDNAFEMSLLRRLEALDERIKKV